MLQNETSKGVLIPEASGLLQYRITKDAIGKYVSIKFTPVRDDGIIGEPRTFLGQEQVRPGVYISFDFMNFNCDATYLSIFVDIILMDVLLYIEYNLKSMVEVNSSSYPSQRNKYTNISFELAKP